MRERAAGSRRSRGHPGVDSAVFSPDGTRWSDHWSDEQRGSGTLPLGARSRSPRGSESPEPSSARTAASLRPRPTDGVARIWDAQTGRARPEPRAVGVGLGESPTPGRHRHRTATTRPRRIRDVRSGGRLAELATGQILDRTLRPGRSARQAARLRGRSKVWEAATGRPLLVFCGHRLAVWDARCSPTGRIVTAGANGDARYTGARSAARPTSSWRSPAGASN